MGNIDQLNYEIILEDNDFKGKLEKLEELAKSFNTNMTNALTLNKVKDGIKDMKDYGKAVKDANKEQKNLNRSLRDMPSSKVKTLGNDLKDVGFQLVNTTKLLQTFGQLTGFTSLALAGRRFLTSLVNITGEFEAQKAALGSMLQNSDKAERLFNEYRKLALESPYTFQDFTKYGKQLLAFNIQEEHLVDTTRMLADVAAGVGVGMDRIILAYGQIKSAGVLKGTELRQLTEAGIPILDELIKQLEQATGQTVKLADVFDLIRKKAIPFEMVEKAFKDMTSAGGKFYNMQSVLVETLKGKIGKLKDVWQQALYDIGQSQDGLLKGSVDKLIDWVSNLQKIGAIIGPIIKELGLFAAGMAAVAATQALISGVKAVKDFISLAKGIRSAKDAMLALELSAKGAKLAIGGIFTIAGLLIPVVMEMTKAERELNKSIKEGEKSIAEEATNVDILFNRLKAAKQGTEEYYNARDAIMSQYGQYLTKLGDEHTALLNVAAAYDAVKTNAIAAANARAIDATTKVASDAYSNTYGKELGKIQASLEKKFGNKTLASGELLADYYFNQIKQALDTGESLSSKVEKALKDAFDQKHIYTNGPNRIGSVKDVTNEVLDRVGYILDAKNTMDAAIGRAEKIFGKSTKTSYTESDHKKELELMKKEVEDAYALFKKNGTIMDMVSVNTNATLKAATDAEFKAILANIEEKIGKTTETIEGGFSNSFSKAVETSSGNQDSALEKAKTIVEAIWDSIIQAQIDAMDDGLDKTLRQIDYNYEKQVEEIKKKRTELARAFQEAGLIDADAKSGVDLETVGEKMREGFKGNVDLLARPLIDAAKLVEKGWKDAGEGIATVFSSGFGIADAEGNEHEILVTPILPDGSVLSPKELEDYVTNVLSGSQDILNADDKKIVIAVDVSEDAGEVLHELQDMFYLSAEAMLTNIPGVPNFKEWLDSVRKNRDAERDDAASKDVTAQQEVYDNLLEKYRDYSTKRKAIEEEYNNEILTMTLALAEAENEVMLADNEEDKEAAQRKVQAWVDAINEAARQKGSALFKLDAENVDDIKNIFSDVSTLTLDQIERAITTAKMLLESGVLTLEETEKVQKALNNLQGTFKDLSINGIGLLLGKEGSLSKKFKDIGNAWKDMKSEEKWKNIGTWASYMGDGLQKAAGYMTQIAEASGNTSLAEDAEAVGALAQNLQAAGQGAAAGGGWGALAAGLLDIIEQAWEASVSYKAALGQAKREQEDFLRSLEFLLYTVKETDFDTVFGTKSIEKAADAYSKAQKALAAYQKYVGEGIQIESYGDSFSKEWVKKLAGVMGADLSHMSINSIKKMFNAYQEGYSQLEATLFRTYKAHRFERLFGGKDAYETLKDYAPELWDATTGEFNVENAEAFLETHKDINVEAERAINNAIKLKKAYDEAMEVVDKEISSNFSNLADSLEEVIYNAVVNGGTDAWDEFNKIGNETIANLGRKLLKEMMISTYMEQFRKPMEAAYGLEDNESRYKELAKITSSMMTGLGENIPYWIELLQGFYDSVNVDIDALKDAKERQGLSKGIESNFSQDTIDYWSGQLTLLVEYAHRGDEQRIAMNEILVNIRDAMAGTENGSYSANVQTYLATIQSDTSSIRADISSMRSTLQNMSDHGVRAL